MIDPIQKAVDDYIEMECKAKAWDKLYDLLVMAPADTPIPSARKVQTKMEKLLEEARK
ncbi:hypothetical protein UFOVP61_32 [uncultured Caudovirales phage]|uniref:Uncharacterized protein n=1 Tax=uncultured Caudovirales phage TaxID=2100421 RepID=A0A6J5KUV5_9CAUD|nr:hypothetical protein UFOVP61_32 [uncultured Caudovirales phage]